MLLHIGIDDTDSPEGGCTTYIAAMLIERLLELGVKFIDYPNLIRLNPNVPWKTRGNGAVCLRMDIKPELEEPVKKVTLEIIENHAEFDYDNTNPGIVFHEGKVPEAYKMFSASAIQGIVTLNRAEANIEEHSSTAIGYNNMRGIIGALASVGECLEGDYTYELLAYRAQEMRGKQRLINVKSVLRMDESTRDDTFNNFDFEKGCPLIAPHGPDPVLFGIRGETAEVVSKAGFMVETSEPIERKVIFRTNQGTDAHLRRYYKISELKPHNPAIVIGEVSARSRTIRGGHVIFPLKDYTGQIDCAAYEPTGSFRKIARHLITHDFVKAYGGVKESRDQKTRTLNLEKLEILQLASKIRMENPHCPECNGRMESMGHRKGYRCRRCSFRGRYLEKSIINMDRKIEESLYLPTLNAHRHLTKPLERYGREKKHHPHLELLRPWYWVKSK